MLKSNYDKLAAFLEHRKARRCLKLLRMAASAYHYPSAVPYKLGRLTKNMAEEKVGGWLKRHRSSYSHPSFKSSPNLIFRLPPTETLKPYAQVYAFWAGQTLKHRFDLLGSGWVDLKRGAPRAGIENENGGGYYKPVEKPALQIEPGQLSLFLSPGNRRRATELWKMIDGPYMPISWNEDFKSGFVWPAHRPSRQQKYGDKPGADIKVPWELSRMHQLPALAFASALSAGGTGGFEAPKIYLREFQNQILDFSAACPPGYGADWVCTMDVAIRSVNILAAYDFFKDQGVEFRPNFTNTLESLLYDHFNHIINNLEYQPHLRANHYYSDVCGLLILSAWLPQTPQITAALAWSIQEFFNETALQFFTDGSNFEASTSYHRLCSELMFYTLAVIKGLEKETLKTLDKAEPNQWQGNGYYRPPHLKGPPAKLEDGSLDIPAKILERAARVADLTLAVTTEKDGIIQIGDNDSGRLLKIAPAINSTGEEDINNHSHIIAAAWAWNGHENHPKYAGHPDAAVIKNLIGKPSPYKSIISNNTGLWRSFPNFGLYVRRWGEGQILSFRCGPNGQNGNGGHGHNDQLSITYAQNETLFLVDPGTYLYTPVPAQRNEFRATKHHNTIFVPGHEQNDFYLDSLFNLKNQAGPELLELSENKIFARHYGFGKPHERTINFGRSITVCDTVKNLPEARLALHFHPEVSLVEIAGASCIVERNGVLLKVVVLKGLEQDKASWEESEFFYSKGYGLKIPSLRLVSKIFKFSLKWEFFKI